ARGHAPAWADELARDLGPWGWLVLLVGPPLLVWLRRRRGAAAHVLGTAPPAAPLTRLGWLEREFHIVLASHVPDQPARDGDGLARALRAAGVDSAVADHVKRLRDRLRAARRGSDDECGGVVRRGRAPRRGRLVRGARGRLATRAGALVQPRRNAVPRRRRRQGDGGLDAGRPPCAA